MHGVLLAMSEKVAVRQFTTAIALGYPFLAHLAIARRSVALTVAAIALLATVILLPSLLRGRVIAWVALPFIGIGGWLLLRTPLSVLPLYAPPVLVPAFMAWVFGHTLMYGRTPLIAQLVRLLHPPDDEPEAAVWPYARGLTLAWTIVFIVLASSNLLLAAFAKPDGLLLAGGINPPFTVPQEWWSLFANIIGYLIAAAFFVIEYAYRRRRFPQQPWRNLFHFIGRTIGAMPRLLRREK